MSMTRNEAAAALSDIERTTERGQVLRGYRIAGPILMLWGLIWAAGYVAMGLLAPERWGQLWIVLDVVGVVGSLVLSRSAGSARRGEAMAMNWRMVVGMLAGLVFFFGTFTLFQASTVEPYLAFPGLVTGLVYIGMGLWRMPRYLWIGATLMIATMVGYVFFQPLLTFWMAAFGGGGLFLAGLWLRKI
ncbi:hypothetical protein [Caulobacter sp. DWR1-3-2b1]|uniref:hypothetical protein n=1 Tax=Caulobacter sp. DWR1-3-2b1 TaxID=2804670 RepID=UPI003CF0660E